MPIAINILYSKLILLHFVETDMRINIIKSFSKISAIASSLNRIFNILNIIDENLR